MPWCRGCGEHYFGRRRCCGHYGGYHGGYYGGYARLPAIDHKQFEKCYPMSMCMLVCGAIGLVIGVVMMMAVPITIMYVEADMPFGLGPILGLVGGCLIFVGSVVLVIGFFSRKYHPQNVQAAQQAAAGQAQPGAQTTVSGQPGTQTTTTTHVAMPMYGPQMAPTYGPQMAPMYGPQMAPMYGPQMAPGTVMYGPSYGPQYGGGVPVQVTQTYVPPSAGVTMQPQLPVQPSANPYIPGPNDAALQQHPDSSAPLMETKPSS